MDGYMKKYSNQKSVQLERRHLDGIKAIGKQWGMSAHRQRSRIIQTLVERYQALMSPEVELISDLVEKVRDKLKDNSKTPLSVIYDALTFYLENK